jgi:hypothetical protein
MKVILNIKVFNISILLYQFYLKKYYINILNIIYKYIKLIKWLERKITELQKFLAELERGWVKEVTRTASAVKNSWQGKKNELTQIVLNVETLKIN